MREDLLNQWIDEAERGNKAYQYILRTKHGIEIETDFDKVESQRTMTFEVRQAVKSKPTAYKNWQMGRTKTEAPKPDFLFER